MVKKIMTGMVLLLVLTVQLFANKPPQQKGGRKRPAISRQSITASRKSITASRQSAGTHRQTKPAHQKHDHHLAKVVRRVIRRPDNARLPAMANMAAVGMPARFDETEDRHLSAEFVRHKGLLQRPLAGTVSMAFGPQEYMGKLHHNNVGITIDAVEGTLVKAVYQGVVTATEEIGDVLCVIIRHGKYYSAYSNLASTTVVRGQHVSVGDTLGQVGDTGQLEFLLMNENGSYVDPEKWLRK